MDNHRIEDFFNKSLEGFNDAPSSAVWAGVDSRLGEEIPFYKKPFFIISSAAILLAFLASGLFCQHIKMKNLIAENQSLNEDIEILKADNHRQIENLKQCQSKNDIQQNEPLDFVKTTIQTQSTYIVQQQNPIVDKIEKTDFNKKSNNLEPTKDLTKNNSNKSTTEQPIEETTVNRNELQLEILNLNYLKSIRPYYSTSRQTMLNALEFPPKSREKKKKNRLEIGLDVFKTDLFLTDGVKSNLGSGQSISYKRAINISKRLQAIGGLGYSTYTYNSNITRDNLLSIAEFPSLNEQLGSINRVRVNSQLINASIGFQYNLTKHRNLTPFIKSSAIWKLYLPQKFEYVLTNGFNRGHIDNRYFAYFGAVDASIGIEKELNHNHSFQLEIFAEKSLVPLGVENVNLTHLGLKTSWLF